MSAALPAFCGYPLDRADHLRSDPAWLAELRGGDALLLVLDKLAPRLGEAGGLAWAAVAEAPADAELVFLGLLEGRGVFGAVPEGGETAPAYTFREMWGLLAALPSPDLALYGGARSVLDWHARHRFCARCGQPTRLAKGGWQRDCPACTAQHFPRTDPVAIMLVEHDGKLLLGRSARYPPRSYSALAGFIEPGESIEEAVAREVQEEAGVRVRDVRYIASQPWPFPSQLMIGCHALADSPDLTIDPSEIEDARWFARAEVAEAMEKGPDSPTFVAPLREAIAHSMLAWWLEQRI
ncbi:MAG: NADH pyrophosphatase [Sphingomonadales bacterium 32-68-7]|nr:MAG: NADH pyrophosphatase [Sphingomonadales bacterium 12-68-11]OYX10455.1 MAG: NADH pyrophosphatase [Sphingomonadales bacterium 32-68-7]